MNRDAIIEHLQPAIDELVDRIVALVPELVRARIVETIGKLTADVTPAPNKAARAVGSESTAIRHLRRDGAQPVPSGGRKPNSCKKCGAVGFTSSTCGKTHNVSTSPASTHPTRAPSTTSSPAASLSKPPPPSPAASIASLRSRRPPKRADASDSPDADSDVPLHKVVAFTF